MALHRSVTLRSVGGRFRNELRIGSHVLVADEPHDAGGDDAGPRPHELLTAALAACTSMTMRMYALRKRWPLELVEVQVEHSVVRSKSGTEKRSVGLTELSDHMKRTIRVHGPLDNGQVQRLLEVAEKCPIL